MNCSEEIFKIAGLHRLVTFQDPNCSILLGQVGLQGLEHALQIADLSLQTRDKDEEKK